MAVIQRRYTTIYPKPVIRPVHLRDTRRTFCWPMLLGAAVLAFMLNFFLLGRARMAEANFKRVQLNSKMSILLVRRQALTSRQIDLGKHDNVKAWAESNNMVQAPNASIYVGRDAPAVPGD